MSKQKRLKKTFLVSAILDMSSKACRDKLRGIVRYARMFGSWQISLHDKNDLNPAYLKRLSDFDGIIANTDGESFWNGRIAEVKRPTALLDFQTVPETIKRYCHISCDNERIGQFGAEHLLECGYSHFAFVMDQRLSHWSTARRDAFAARVKQAGFICDCYNDFNSTDEQCLVNWIRSLPLPVGIMAALDERGLQVIGACHTANRRVPMDVGVVAVDDDDIICMACEPNLSSVVNDNEQGGFIAAQALDQLMRGIIRKPRELKYNPLSVNKRQSTGQNFLIDQYVQEALNLIEANAGTGINVTWLAHQIKISRRLLEVKFRESLNVSIHQQIQLVRFRKVKKLLLETNLDIGEIAMATGFESEQYLSFAFKKLFGKTASRFRRDRE